MPADARNVVHEVTGRLARSRNPESFAEEILPIIDDPANAERLGQAAHRYVLERHRRAPWRRLCAAYRRILALQEPALVSEVTTRQPPSEWARRCWTTLSAPRELVEIGTVLGRCEGVARLIGMRGDERVQDGMFSYVSLEQRVPQDHPLRAVRKLTDTVLRTLSQEFDALYADSGRPSIAPEYILRALLLQVFYSVRSERLLVEQIEYNLLFRWFVGLGMDDAVWNHAVFSKNRDRLLTSDVAQQFFAEVNKQAKRFMSDEHFTVDGTLIQAWASQKSFRSKDGSGDGDGTDFRGQSRSNKTHEWTTDSTVLSFDSLP